jgi:WXG100 family type VII secretion target
MTILKVNPEDLRAAANELAEAHKESQATLTRVDQAMTALENKWQGASRQIFYRNYKDWRTAMGGMAVLLKQISREMTEMAADFKKADFTT